MAPTSRWVAGAVLALVATGCSRSGVDEDAWRKDLEAAGARNPDLAKALPLARDVCAADDAALRRYVESIWASGDTGLRIVRANFRHVCPEEQQRLERAITVVSRG